MFHGIAAYQSSSASKTCFTVNSDDSSIRLCDVHKVIKDTWRWNRTVNELQVRVRDILRSKFRFFVLSFVQTDYTAHVKVVEHLQVIFRGIPVSSFTVFGIDRTHESDKLVWNNNIHIAILNLLIVLVFFVVKSV